LIGIRRYRDQIDKNSRDERLMDTIVIKEALMNSASVVFIGEIQLRKEISPTNEPTNR